MKLLLLSDFFYPHISGGALARYEFAKDAANKGHDITVFTPMREGGKKRELKSGIKINRPFKNKPEDMVPDNPIALFTRLFYSVFFFLVLVIWLKKNDVDYIQTTEHIFHPIGKLLGIIFDIPVLSFVGYTPSLKGKNSLLETIIFKYFLGEKTLCRSIEVKEKIEKLSNSHVKILHGIVNVNRIEKVVENIDVDEIRDRIGIEEYEIIITMVGRLTPVKNVQKGVEIISKLPEKYNLVIVGDGPERKNIENKIDDLGLKERVRMAGRLEHKEALEIISASDLIMITSKAEAYPTVAFEALAMRKKVIATPVGILKEISEENLFTVPTDEMTCLIKKLKFKQVETGIDSDIASRYSMKRYTEQTLNFLEGDDE